MFKLKINNHLSPQKHHDIHITLEIQVLAWDRHKNMVGLNQLIIVHFVDLSSIFCLNYFLSIAGNCGSRKIEIFSYFQDQRQ